MKPKPAAARSNDIAALARGTGREIVASLRSHGYRCDCSLRSLADIDRLIDEHSKNGVAVPGGFFDPPEIHADAKTRVYVRLVALGCYVGEVLIRSCGGAWHSDSDKLTPKTLRHLEVLLPSAVVACPVSKVFKRFANGPEDSVRAFGCVVAALARDGSSGRKRKAEPKTRKKKAGGRATGRRRRR